MWEFEMEIQFNQMAKGRLLTLFAGIVRMLEDDAGQFPAIERILTAVLDGRHAHMAPGVVNTSLAPRCPVGFKVVAHLKNGVINLTTAVVSLHTPRGKVDYGPHGAEGGVLFSEIPQAKKILGVGARDAYLANPEFIPHGWQSHQRIMFLGTRYRDHSGEECVPCLFFLQGEWKSGFASLAPALMANTPVAFVE